jgi:glycosyltransferase involved in cell wall biosynthesis
MDVRLERLERMLLAVLAEEAENRRRLYRLRDSREYELPYTEAEPLVTVTIPTIDRAAILRERTLPSVLGQSYRNLEVIVVGDASPPAVEEAVRSFGDPRLSFRNLTQRIVAYDEPRRHHWVGSTMGRNEASRVARGHWFVAFDDDDVMLPHHVERLLEAARERRLEVAYGRTRIQSKKMDLEEVGEFPPGLDWFGFRSAIYHGGLRFLERELVVAAMDTWGERYLLERMLRIGVRFGMVDEIVAEYHPSKG